MNIRFINALVCFFWIVGATLVVSILNEQPAWPDVSFGIGPLGYVSEPSPGRWREGDGNGQSTANDGDFEGTRDSSDSDSEESDPYSDG